MDRVETDGPLHSEPGMGAIQQTGAALGSPRRHSGRASQFAFLGISSVLFAACAAATIAGGGSMSGMSEMAMPGGWTMSMTWMRMPGQSWFAAEASFVAMWVVMMVAMMLPCLVPVLWRYRRAVAATGGRSVDALTALAGVGYFFVWTVCGVIAYPVGVALAATEMQQAVLAHAVPVIAGGVVLLAGALQFTAWKIRQLACCREAPRCGGAGVLNAAAAWRCGLRLGLRCSACCAPLTAILLVVGIMDLRMMALVTAAVGLERLVPGGERLAQAIGILAVGAGTLMIGRAAGLG
jgi:predicted metal-binding membrane protein